jgi:hypothetical protein
MIFDVLTRRLFTTALASAAIAAGGGEVVLRAIYGKRLPATLRVSRRVAADHPYFELREYSGLVERLEDLVARAGMRRHMMGAGKFLIPFNSLDRRGQTWDRFNADPEWVSLRHQVRLIEMTIYCQPGGKIFDISL